MPCPPFLPPSSALRLRSSIPMPSGTLTFSAWDPTRLWERTSDRDSCPSLAPALRRLSQQSRSPPRRLARYPARRNPRPRRSKRLRQKHSFARHPPSPSLERRHRPRQSTFQRGRPCRKIRIADALPPRPRNQYRSAKSPNLPQSRSAYRLAAQRSLARSRHRHAPRMHRSHRRRTHQRDSPQRQRLSPPPPSTPPRRHSPPPPPASPTSPPKPPLPPAVTPSPSSIGFNSPVAAAFRGWRLPFSPPGPTPSSTYAPKESLLIEYYC